MGQCHRFFGEAHKDNVGDCNEALKNYKEASKLSPNHAWPSHYMGMANNDIGQCQDAIQNSETYVELRLIENDNWIESQQAADAYTNLGLAYIEFGQNQETMEHFDKDLTIEPNYSDALSGREKATKSLV